MDDLRELMEQAKKLGDFKLIEGANWDLEIGAITELEYSRKNPRFLLFDKIPDHKAGYRVATNLFTSYRLAALALGLPIEAKGLELVKAWRDKVKDGIKPIPPVKVDTGPIKENVRKGAEVNLLEYPTPKWHEHDGGRYIGTGVAVIQRDPDDDHINLGTYRVQIHDKNTVTVYMSPGRHGDEIRRKYWARGQSCPVAISCGQEPAVYAAASWRITVGEYEYAGGIKNKPIEVVTGVTTGLPIPATAEIVLEGEMLPPGADMRPEGPFGEWTGYYASSTRPEPAVKINATLHRNNPIIMGVPPSYLYSRASLARHILLGGLLWAELDKQVPGIKGVWMPEEATPAMVIISLEQKYAGHAKQAAMVAAGCRITAYMLRHIIVVDDDIDPSNISEVFWALNTRCEPEDTIDVLRGCWGSPLDPMLSPERRSQKDFKHSTSIILACKPYSWMADFPRACKFSREKLREVEEKWRKYLTS